ncbi:hypothetical protein ACHAO4_004912 [Trichoderma viride]
MAVHQDVSRALQEAATRHHQETRLRKEEQSQRLRAHDYHCLQKKPNKKKFLAPLDADTTQASIFYIKKCFIRFCHEKKHGLWRHATNRRRCDKGLIMTFLHWICETYLQPWRKRSKKKTVNQYWRDFKMLYQRTNKGRVINANDCEEIVKYIDGHLRTKFNLDDLPGSKPVMGVDNLLLGLTHHWSRDAFSH